MKRIPKEDDQDKSEIAYTQLMAFLMMQKELNIESALWCGAMLTIIAEAYAGSGATHKQFAKEMKYFLEHTKTWWDEHDEDSI